MTICYPDIPTKFKRTSEPLRTPKDSQAMCRHPIPEVPHVFCYVQQDCASSSDMSPRPSQGFSILGCVIEVGVANPGVKCRRSGEE
ncbi:hypothetical protein B0H65DRAFT_510957 [Neurospora tetraspora]|uniref:Uncharacterized protein n=1 Tax=Neurospora tetraspora TaxID=94610 RepID=A0AAE0MPU4_9PEZI|nr:hypothetical protein B0H65DRAFT_510957 [Neurospora tetraspora]